MITYTPKIYAKLLFSLLKEKELNSQVLKNFLEILLKNNQLKTLKRIFVELEKLYKQELNIIEVKVFSPEKLDGRILSSLKKEISQKYKSERIIINEVLDKNLIGGLKIQIEDEIIDASLKNLLFKLEKSLII
jgi:F-type H+-transporting ATPase subunit delta